MKTFLKWLAAISIVFALIIFVIFIIISSLLDTEPKVVSNSYLHISLSGGIPEYIPPDPIEDFIGGAKLDMKKIRDDLEKAKIDDRINGVLLDVHFTQTGYAKLQELYHLISEFRKGNKKIYAYLGSELAFTKDYYIACACDSIFMSPSANLFLTGINSEITFYKGFFKKIGVEAEFVHVGKYKNAPDTYTSDSMSPDHRYVLENVFDQYYDDIINTIAESRGLPRRQVENIIQEQSGFTGDKAKELGLIDETAFYSDVEDRFNLTGEKPSRLSAIDYAEIPASSLKIRNKSRIAVIYCAGVIAGGGDSDDLLLGQISGARSIINNIERAADSKTTKAIILRIDSPGGSAGASDEIWDAILKARLKKPVIASISDYGASGGYLIAIAADTLIAAPASLVGSIGIFAGKFNLANLYKKLDLKTESVSRGKNAALFSVMQPWKDSERTIIFNLISDFYENFVQKTANARQLTYGQVDQIAQGRVWTGKQAVEVGLLDATGSFYSAVEAAKELANIDKDESVRLTYYPRKKSALAQLFSAISMRMNIFDSIEAVYLKRTIDYINRIQNKPMALMPFRIQWN